MVGEFLCSVTVWVVGWLYSCAKHKATIDNVNRLDGVAKFGPGSLFFAWVSLITIWPIYLGSVSDDKALIDAEISRLNKMKWKPSRRSGGDGEV